MAKKQNISIKSETINIAATPVRTNISTISEIPVRPVSTLSVPQRENFIRPLDPQRLAWQAKYKTQGLTVTSNNQNIIPRDGAGNIVLKENEQNPLLIIEPVATKITTDSVLKVIDTRFNYYKFPVTVIETTSNDIDLDTEINLETADPIFARYRPDQPIRIPMGAYQGDVPSPSPGFNFVEEGSSQKLPGHYYITKEIKDSGANLRFRIQIQHRLDGWNAEGYGTCYFGIIKKSPVTDVSLIRGVYANSSTRYPDVWGSIFLWEVQTLYIDVIIRNEEFLVGDYFTIGAVAGQNDDQKNHQINTIQSYWSITDASKNVDTWNQEI